ncbi:hypothetical protein [Halorussus aquaticus]|uniref:Lipoprotein n=1 Tax=Halorussus aquaticus TaxID=2953748 RepID=A0ABD5PZZ9_9EURY|nr:hypothetical protein [Halorussus aquaticus]
MNAPNPDSADYVSARSLQTLGLGILLVLAGCTAGPLGGPSGQEGPVPVALNNSANATHTFEVSVVEGPLTDVTIRKGDGDVDSASPGEGLSTYEFGPDYGTVTSVELPESSRLHGRYTLAPGETRRSSVGNLFGNPTIVVVVSTDDRVVSLVTANCGGDLVFFDVTMRYYGSDSAYNCRESFF